MEEYRLLLPLLEQLKEIVLLSSNGAADEEMLERLMERVDNVMEGISLGEQEALERLLILLAAEGEMESIAFQNNWDDILREIRQMTAEFC